MAIHKMWQVEPLKTALRKVSCQNAAAKILSPAYHFVERFFAGHIHGFTVMEHGAYYSSNPKMQSILEILHKQISYSLILHFFGNFSDFYFFKNSRRKI